MRKLFAALLISVLFPMATSAQESVAAGAGFTSGIIGVEALWGPETQPVRLGVGAGVAGLGMRVLIPRRVSDGLLGEAGGTRYVSGGYLLTPWNFGLIDAAGAFGVEFGVRIPYSGRPILADLAAGAILVHGGSWGGSIFGPTFRLQIGLQRRGD
jgi:hypothetical protein